MRQSEKYRRGLRECFALKRDRISLSPESRLLRANDPTAFYVAGAANVVESEPADAHTVKCATFVPGMNDYFK